MCGRGDDAVVCAGIVTDGCDIAGRVVDEREDAPHETYKYPPEHGS